MKNYTLPILAAFLLFLNSCASDEEIRVQSIVGIYDCASVCVEVDLTGQIQDSTTYDNRLVYVRKAEDWDDGFIFIDDKEVFLQVDSTFSVSETDYFLAGEFTSDGRLIFTESVVDRANSLRDDCDYVGYLK